MTIERGSNTGPNQHRCPVFMIRAKEHSFCAHGEWCGAGGR
jgi:hypothetical protein